MYTTWRFSGTALLALLSLFAASPAQARRPEAAGVELLINVSGTRVLVDGEVKSSDAPPKLTLELPPGTHSVHVEKDGFQSYDAPVEVQAAGKTQVNVALKLVQPPTPATAEAPLPVPGAARGVRIAVYDLSASEGVEPRTARIVTEAVVAEVRKLEGVSAIGYKEIQEMISFERRRELLGCSEDSCLAEIAGALGVDELVSGNLGSLGATRQFNLRRIDLKKGKVKGAVTRQLVAGDGEELLGVVGPAVEQLFPDHPVRGDRKRGVSTETVAKLNPPPLPAWSFYGTAGLTVAAAGAATYLGLSFLDEQAQYHELLAQSVETPVSASEVDAQAARVDSGSRLANVALLVAAGLAVVTGVEYFFTDFQGAGSSSDEQASAPAAAALQLKPTGLALSF